MCFVFATGRIQTGLPNYSDELEYLHLALSKFNNMCYTFQIVNNIGADQTARINKTH